MIFTKNVGSNMVWIGKTGLKLKSWSKMNYARDEGRILIAYALKSLYFRSNT